MKELFLLRGIPGAGKTTLANSLGGKHLEADMYFIVNGKYNFDPSKLKYAHEWCYNKTEDAMKYGTSRVIVSNTFTRKWEMENYIKLAEQYNYTIFTIIVENRHGGKSIHNIDESTINKMKSRFEINL